MKKCTSCESVFEVMFECETQNNTVSYCPNCGHYCGLDLNTLHLFINGCKSELNKSSDNELPCELIFKINDFDFNLTDDNNPIYGDFCVKQGDDTIFIIDNGLLATFVDLRNMKARLSNHSELCHQGKRFLLFGGRIIVTFHYYSQPEDRDEFIYAYITLLSKDNKPFFELDLDKCGTEELLSFFDGIIDGSIAK